MRYQNTFEHLCIHPPVLFLLSFVYLTKAYCLYFLDILVRANWFCSDPFSRQDHWNTVLKAFCNKENYTKPFETVEKLQTIVACLSYFLLTRDFAFFIKLWFTTNHLYHYYLKSIFHFHFDFECHSIIFYSPFIIHYCSPSGQ